MWFFISLNISFVNITNKIIQNVDSLIFYWIQYSYNICEYTSITRPYRVHTDRYISVIYLTYVTYVLVLDVCIYIIYY